MKHRLRQFEAASLLYALERERKLRGDAWPVVLNEFARDLEQRFLPRSAQTADLMLEIRAARPQDAGMATVSLSEAGRLLGVHRDTVRGMVKRGQLAAVQVGARLRVRLADLERIAGGGAR